MATWDNVDVMELIVRRLTSPEDVASFSGVSRVWRSAAAKRKIRFRSSLVPWLMLPAKQGTDLRSFFSLSEGMSRDSRQIIIPEANGNKCYSSKGWLMVINRDWSLFLLHPFSRLRIQLPHIRNFQNWEDFSVEDMEFSFIGKSVLSASPSLVLDYTLMAIYGNTSKVAYFRPGFKGWMTIEYCQSSYCDVIFYEGMFFLIDVKGTLISIDLRSDNTTVGKHLAKWPMKVGPFKDPKFYLVESAGKLLGVARYTESVDPSDVEFPNLTWAFDIYELDWSSNTWTKVDNLGNRALFLGANSSLSVEVSDVSICKPNSIYFTDDRQKSYRSINEGGKDMGIYNLQEMSIEPFFKGSNIYDQITPPMWVEQADDMDQSVLDFVRLKIEEELKKLDEKIADAEENLGESEAREAHLAKSLFYIQIGYKDKALEQLKVTESRTVAVGQKMDLVFYTLQLGFLYMDFDLISKSIEKANSLFEEGGDWERKNHLKVYEGLHCMSTRNFKMAADLFLDSISTFTTYELFPYDTFIFYTVLMSIISLDRVSLKQKVVDAPEILTVIGKIPYLSEFLNSLYDCQYKSFFSAFAGLMEKIKLDRYLHPHFGYYMREVRSVVYSQFLESYKGVTIEAMAKAFGESVESIDLELFRLIAAEKASLQD